MRAVGVILMMIGALVGGTGGYALSQYVRPGDWVVGRSETINPNHERVVVSAYGSTSYDSGLRITTTAPVGQAVFIGTANPIDVDDYTKDVMRVEVTKMDLLKRIETSDLAGSKDLPADPVGLDFWLDHRYGQGAQSLVVSDSAAPAQVMIVAAADQPISVRVDHVVTGLRKVLFSVIGVGACLVFIGLTLLVAGIVRRRNRRQPPDLAPTPTAQMPMAPASAPQTPPLARWIAGMLALSVVLATTGCAVPQTPKQVDAMRRSDVTKTPLPQESISLVTADLERRMGAARAASSSPTYSAEAWKTVYADTSLAWRTFGTALAKASGDTVDLKACGVVVVEVYGDQQHAYPMTVTALLKWSCTPTPERIYSVLTRAHSYDHWLIAAEAAASAEATPPKGSTDAVTVDEKKQAGVLYSGVVSATKEGAPGPLGTLVKALSALDPLFDKADTTISVTVADPATYPTSAVVSKTQSGMLMTFSMISTITKNAKPGFYLYWNPPLDQLLNQPGHRQSLTRRYLTSVTVTFDGGTPTVLGTTQRPIF